MILLWLVMVWVFILGIISGILGFWWKYDVLFIIIVLDFIV